MLYIIMYVAFKFWHNMGVVFIQLLLEFFHNHFLWNLKPTSFEQTNTIILLFQKFKKHYV